MEGDWNPPSPVIQRDKKAQLRDVSGSLKILDKFSIILPTKKYDTNTSFSFSSRTFFILVPQKASLT